MTDQITGEITMTNERLKELRDYLIDLELKQLDWLKGYAGENDYINVNVSPEQLNGFNFRLKLNYTNGALTDIEVFSNSYKTSLVSEPDFWAFQRLLDRNSHHLLVFKGE